MENFLEIIRHYPDKRSALLPTLNKAQQIYGALTPEAMQAVADALELTPSHVRGVATFHVMFRQNKMGRNLIQLCTNIACMLFGAETLVDIITDRLGIGPGETTEDGRYSLIIMECIGACDTPPAMLVNSDFHACVNKHNILGILGGYK